MGHRDDDDARRRKQQRDPKVREKAEKLVESGMPFQMAMAVAHGRVTLNDALERMATQEKAGRLAEEHDLSRALATQIAKGHASLDAVLARRRLDEYREDKPLRSCLDDMKAVGGSLSLALHGGRTVSGRVDEVEAFMVRIVPVKKGAEGDPEEIHKLQIKYAYQPPDWKRVRKALRYDKDLQSNPVAPIVRPQDRYTCSTKRLFRYMDEELPVQAILLEGEQFRGVVTWFSRYEFGIRLRGDVEVTVFRHALHDLTTI